MTNPKHLELHGLTKVYDGSVRAVDDVDLSVREGEFVTLVGPSGCGKSTTLRMLAGFVEPTEGTVEMNFTDITQAPPDKRDVGMVFQSIALFPHMSVKENIAYGMRVADKSFTESEVDERVTEMLELIEMPGYEDRMPEQLSGGQSQRVGLARALALEPEMLLLDEPLSALDEKLREHMQTELTRIQRELGVTTVFVTHNQEEAMTMSDRIVVMNDGNFEQIGTPEAVYNQPESVFVGDFMGKSNVFSGRMVRQADDFGVFDTDFGEIAAAADGFTADTSAQLLVRPENLSITRRDEAEPGAENSLHGEVGLVQLIGSVVEYEVETEYGPVTVEVQSSGTIDFERGDEVTVTFDPVDVRTFAESDDSEAPDADETVGVAS
ncbi:ABC transporter ATP-binding protein [Haloarcula sp. S1CR25-12]|uniref:Molybdate/tungstate import ATP-binding protein WtpC n=1 Tax=Haloarcula saliterrae TaxID=2950534 RepID=A0ABU2FFN9_9EURY|nr:ABC transporter ATP-binding protein [Haloarcula sp. S1CR25-12]MDS0261075.1 ABC transporter ATP-binding protein [Haloarcula sp. S1CR25-12]